MRLWFDVGIKRYTTCAVAILTNRQLWFDVGIKRYTTNVRNPQYSASCGLM